MIVIRWSSDKSRSRREPFRGASFRRFLAREKFQPRAVRTGSFKIGASKSSARSKNGLASTNGLPFSRPLFFFFQSIHDYSHKSLKVNKSQIHHSINIFFFKLKHFNCEFKSFIIQLGNFQLIVNYEFFLQVVKTRRPNFCVETEDGRKKCWLGAVKLFNGHY